MFQKLNPRRWLVIVLLLTSGGGCTSSIIPPPAPVDPVTVAVLDYGRHTAIVLPTNDHMVEYAYGDWRWFALGDTRLHVGIGALIRSPQAALGRRTVTASPDNPHFAQRLGAERFLTFQASRERVASLLQRLDERFARGGEPHFSSYSELWLVRDDGRYHLLHNSNHFTARQLEYLGATVRGHAITSKMRLR